MSALLLAPVVVSVLLLGAHFLRAGEIGLVAASAASLPLLLLRSKWVAIVFQIGLAAGILVWLATALDIVAMRSALSMTWGRAVLIVCAVATFTGLSAVVFRTKRLSSRYSVSMRSAWPSAVAFVIVVVALGAVQLRVSPPMLLPERFVPGAGWLAVLGLGVYAAWLAEKMLDPAQQPKWRLRAWLFFSIVFFAQLALGLSGLDRFLLTGELHLPVPALIVAGPLFRGEGLFMPVLLAATVLLVGPAWCSHLCYIGAWDNALALRRRRPARLPRWTRSLRIGLLVAVVAVAALLHLVGASIELAFALALTFGLIGVAVMVLVSGRLGAMAHCAVYCPVGLVADLVGKLNPFRIRIGKDCTECGKCSLACRYDALSREDIARKHPALSCSLCGDCVDRCETRQIGYRFPGLSPDIARAAFVVLVVSLHAVFLGVARV